MKISVVMAFATRQQLVKLHVKQGCTARQAVHQAIANGLKVEPDDLADDANTDGNPKVESDTRLSNARFDVQQAPLGIYGERVADDKLVSEGDRVEIYRPLQQDPMELRRQRAALEPGRFPGRRK